MACIAAPTLPTELPFGLSLGVPKLGVGINLGIDFCCQFNIPIGISTDDLIALLQAAGINIHALSFNANLLKPIQAQLILVNTYLKQLPLSCPLDGT